MASGDTHSSRSTTGRMCNRVCDACAFESKNEKAVSFCVECAEYLCTNCTRDHKKNRASRNHKVLENNEALDKPEIFRLMKQMLACPDHTENDVTLKCVEHNTFVCTVCVAVNHRQCHDVTEVSKDMLVECATEENKARLLNTLENVNTTVSAFQTAKKANIESLRLDAARIQEERQTYLCALYNHLEELCMLSEQETESKMKKEIDDLEKDIGTAKELKVEDNLQLLQLVANHGNVQQQNIICEKISKQASLLVEGSKTLRHKENISLKFEKNKAFEKVTSLGTIDSSREPVSSCFDGDHFEVSVSSDALEEEVCFGSSVTAHKTGADNLSSSPSTKATRMECRAPLLKSKLSKDIVSYDIDCSHVFSNCSVSAIVLLSDGHFVLADKDHQLIKFLGTDFSLLSTWEVPHEPIDLCEPVNGCLAVIYDGVKEIGRFSFDNNQKTFYSTGKFQTKLFPISISKSKEGIAVLFSDEMRDTQKSSDDDTIEIQIRLLHNSKIIQTINSFEKSDSDDLELTDTDRILVLDTDPELFIVTESNEIHCFEISETDSDIFREAWYYKSHGNKVLKEASDVAADDEGNVYVCGKVSKNIHQVSRQNFRNNRVLFSVESSPTALCVDSERRRIIVGCDNDSCIYVASFD